MKPILFNSDMVRALLDGNKTVTRRVVKPQPEKCAHSPYECCGGRFAFRIGDRACTNQYKPPYRPGDILYVRETWDFRPDNKLGYIYRADYDGPYEIKWRPSIHMPREAARIFLRVTGVRVERLQGITAAGAIAEGVCWEDVISAVPSLPDNPAWDMDAVIAEIQEREERELIEKSYGTLWDNTLKHADRALYGWDANPWVWWIEFERCEKPTSGNWE